MQGMGSANPLNDEPPEPPPFEFGDRALIVLPGISWDEWVRLWQTAEGMHQSSNFYVGDALLAGQREFGERFAQVVDQKYINQQRGALWVCSRIEPARRKANLSFSLHREVAALDPAEQDRWLDLADQGNWTVKDLREELAADRARHGNGGPPLDEEITSNANAAAGLDEIPASEEIGSTWNENPTPTSPEAIDGTPVPVPLAGPTEAPTESAPPDTPVTPETIRAAIAAVRRVSNEIALFQIDRRAIMRVEGQVMTCLVARGGRFPILPGAGAPGAHCLTDYDSALSLIPGTWKGKIVIEFGEHVFGGRTYAVTLVRPGGKQMAAGLAPTLACAIVDSALAALLSDMGAY